MSTNNNEAHSTSSRHAIHPYQADMQFVHLRADMQFFRIEKPCNKRTLCPRWAHKHASIRLCVLRCLALFIFVLYAWSVYFAAAPGSSGLFVQIASVLCQHVICVTFCFKCKKHQPKKSCQDIIRTTTHISHLAFWAFQLANVCSKQEKHYCLYCQTEREKKRKNGKALSVALHMHSCFSHERNSFQRQHTFANVTILHIACGKQNGNACKTGWKS